jgi:hypothetical protein
VKVEDIRMCIKTVEKWSLRGKGVRESMEEIEQATLQYTHSGDI